MSTSSSTINFEIKVNFEFKVNFEINVNFEFKFNFEIKLNFENQWKTQFRLNIGREPTLPPWRRAALPEPEPGGAEPGNPSPAARHGSASRRRYDSENLRPVRMFVRVISCSSILLVRIACSRPQSSAFFPPGRSRRARCRAVETFCGSRSATPRSMQPEDIGQRGATRPNWSLAPSEKKYLILGHFPLTFISITLPPPFTTRTKYSSGTVRGHYTAGSAASSHEVGRQCDVSTYRLDP
ncbi:unnamed protein product [Nesidiocoris tenuis]|uniref:Uncharacterized protein n=1 Tax=Nesidiocoris tenuis TaxID=355587 RepID=A0A6H5H805_9HEMI|nr:unnamed protein product [Nesidiocoris tenuis]